MTDCDIVRNRKTDELRGFAFVTFRKEVHGSHELVDCLHLTKGGPVNVRPCKIKAKEGKINVPSNTSHPTSGHEGSYP
ncbi:hypothetical protein TcWFU_001555 [Taenia crassiceps]|uniref:RRM domain-containing protein n=1 Tax=Taenia crassiceps TaxID=6207 RepID=A0ABR4QNZ7_9CEST